MRGLYLTLFISCVILTVCDTHASPGNTRSTRYRRGPRPGHNTNTGEMSHLRKQLKRKVGASCFFLAVVVLAQSSCPGHGCLISSSSGGDIRISVQAGEELGGRANSREKHVIVIQVPPSQQHIRHSCAPKRSQTFHRVLLLLYSVQRSLPRLKSDELSSLPV